MAGVIAYGGIPIAALPSYDTPTISVSASLPGASPETMASSVATPLEKQFSTISGLSVISSTSTLGNTSITLEFDQDRNIDSAAVDVQAALLRAQRALPTEMTTPPSYRKVNPADAPVIFLALTSPSMPLSDLNSFAENLISPTLSTLAGVAQVNINGQKSFAVRVRVSPEALAARNLTLDDIASALRSANANTPVGTLEGPRQTLTIQANRQLRQRRGVRQPDRGHRARRQRRCGCRRGRRSKTAWSRSRPQAGPTANAPSRCRCSASRAPTRSPRWMRSRRRCPGSIAQMPSSVQLKLRNDRSVSIRDAIHDVQVTLAITIALVVLVIFLFLRKATATFIPALSLPISLLGTVALMCAFGYSLDNISLLAITLAVGLVVDDAIVVLENIVRHVENGDAAAAGRAARLAGGGLHHHLDLRSRWSRCSSRSSSCPA